MKLLGWILRIVVAALGIGLFLLQSQYAKKSILEFIVNQPLEGSPLTIEAEGIRGLFPFQFSVASLELKEGQDRRVHLSNISAVWSIPALMSREIRVGLVKEGELAGNLTYVMGQHALFVNMRGKGLPLGKKGGALLSLDIDLPTLDLLKGQITATLYDGLKPATLTLQLEETPNANLRLKDILLTGEGIKGKGHGVMDLKQGKWEGQASLLIEDLAPYDVWFHKGLVGFATLKCQKTLQDHINVDLELNEFRYGEFEAKTVKAQATMEKTDHLKLTVHSQDVVLNGIPLEVISGAASFGDRQGSFDFTGAGSHNISFRTQGIFDLPTAQFPQTKITLNQAELTHPMHQFTLQQPTTFAWSDEKIEASKIWLTTGPGMVVVRDLSVGDQLSGDILVDRLPLTLLRVIDSDWIASGHLSGKGKLKGTKEKPGAELSLEGKSLQWGAPVKPPSVSPHRFLGIDLSSTFTLSEGFLTWKVKCVSGRLFTLTSQGNLFLGHQWIPSAESSIDASLKGQGDMGAISLFISSEDLIKGQASVDLSATGTVKTPFIKGDVAVTKGIYENAAYGTYIKNIKLQGTASGDVLTLSHIAGQDNSKGYVNGRGSVKFTSLLNPDVNIQLNLDQMIVVQNDELSGKASGALKLQGSLVGNEQTKAKITGDVTIKPLEVRLDEHTEKIVTIQLLEKKKDGTYQTPVDYHHQELLQQGPSFLPLDIKLSSPGQVYLRGFGFDAQWKGDVRVVGAITDPQLVGEITLVRGKFDLLGKPLKLTEGRVTYSQEPKNDPLLAIAGSREIGEITATMHIEGHASNPKITFSSMPPLPQEEILARLIFGKGLESMSVTQSLLLANALSTFKGKNNLNFTDKIRSAFGLDVLEFKERKAPEGDDFESSSQLVSVGKQLSDKVYLSIDQSMSGEGGTTATVQFDVTPTLKIEADVGGGKDSALGFTWVKRY